MYESIYLSIYIYAFKGWEKGAAGEYILTRYVVVQHKARLSEKPSMGRKRRIRGVRAVVKVTERRQKTIDREGKRNGRKN